MNNFIQSITNPMQGAIQGFQHPQQPSGDSMQRFLDTVPILKNIRGMNEGAFGQQAVNHPEVQVAADTGGARWSAEMRGAQKTGLNNNMLRALTPAEQALQNVQYQQYLQDVAMQKSFQTPPNVSNIDFAKSVANGVVQLRRK